jgi:hypothetical protein
MTKLRIQAQHLQPGDVVGSGEKVVVVNINSTSWPSNKIKVHLQGASRDRATLWGKYTMINVEREEK